MSSLPGMITRLRSDVLRQLPQTVPESPSNLKEWKDRVRNKYAPIAGLSHTFAVLNDPAPMDGVTSGKGGHAPRWSGPLLPWVGGSLAGYVSSYGFLTVTLLTASALKTSGPEMLREEYDTRVTESLARGEAFAAAVKEERGDAAPPTDGIALDDLCPGMAVGALAQQRKRGWTPSGALGDWTTGKVCASG